VSATVTPSRVNLEDKLRGSISFESLVAEQFILRRAQSHRWRCAHGAFFVDPTTAKTREADVLATRCWKRRRSGNDDRVELSVPIEVKSARGFHILFPATRTGSFRTFHDQNILWLGEVGAAAELMADRVAELGFSPQIVSDFEKKLFRAAYPRHFVCLAKLIIDPFRCDVMATTFRETNVGSEKELETSVVWKAVQALSSLVDSLKRAVVTARFEDVEIGVTSARRQGEDGSEILNDLLESVRYLSRYHPIVVIEAPLWLVGEQGQLAQISACPFEQVQAGGGFSRWVDIVHRPHFDEFFSKLTAYYERAFKKAGARPC
jgi:hypothetical protein